MKFTDVVLERVVEALRQSHGDKKAYHDQAVAKLNAECEKVTKRLDKLYTDKLDGVIDEEAYKRHAKQWNNELRTLRHDIESHDKANGEYLDDGVTLLELAQKAHKTLLSASPEKQRKLLQIVCSNSEYKDGVLSIKLHQPFEQLRVTNVEQSRTPAEKASKEGDSTVWYPLINDVCAVLRHPRPRLRQMVIEAKAIAGAA